MPARSSRSSLLLAGALLACGCAHRYQLPPEPPQAAGGAAFVLQSGHQGSVGALAFSADGERLASGGEDGLLKIWDARSGVVLVDVRATGRSGMLGGVAAVAFSPDGRLVATGGGHDAGGEEVHDAAVRLWDAGTGALVATLYGHSRPVTALAFAPAGALLASGGDDGRVILWDPRTGAEVRALESRWRPIPGFLHWVKGDVSAVESLRFSADGSALRATFWDGASEWNPQTGEVLDEPEGPGRDRSPEEPFLSLARVSAPALTVPAKGVWSHQFSPDGARLATSSTEGLHLWDAGTGSLLARAPGLHGRALAFSPDGDLLALGDGAGQVSVLSARDLSSHRSLGAARAVARLGWTSEGDLAAGSRLWDRARGVPRAGHGGALHPGPGGRWLLREVPSKDNPRLAQALEVVEASGGKVLASLPAGRVAWTRDGQRLAVLHSAAGQGDGSVATLYAPGSGQRATTQVPVERTAGLAFEEATGRLLVAEGRTYDSEKGPTLRTFDAATGAPLGAVEVSFAGDLGGLAFSADGALLAGSARKADGVGCDVAIATKTAVSSCAGEEIVVVETSSGRVLQRFTDHLSRVELAFAPLGSALISLSAEGTLLVHEPRSGELVRRHAAPGPLGALSVSPDGRFLAVSGLVGRLVRLEDGAQLQLEAFPGGEQLLYSAGGSFSGDDPAFGKVFFRVGGGAGGFQMLSADQLFEQFHRPSLLDDFLSGRPLDSAPRALAEAGAAPGLSFAQPLPERTSSGRLKVLLSPVDRGGGVGEIRVFVNGARADAGARGFRRQRAGVHEVEVELSPGENLVEAEAYGVKGRLRSARISGQVTFEAPQPEKPDLHVLAITLDQYADPAQPLNYANADGQAFLSALAAQQGRLYGAVHARRLADQEATRPGIEAALKELAAQARPSDVLVVYAASHGVTVQCEGDALARYTLVTWKASLRSDRTLCEHGLTDARMAELLREVPARKKLLVLDTCQAGAAATERTLAAMRGAAEIDAIKRLARSEGVAIVAAATAAEYAGEVRELGHGVFTKALLDGLSGAAKGRDGTVSVFGLLSFLQDEVPALSERFLGRPQYPIATTQGQDFPVAAPAP